MEVMEAGVEMWCYGFMRGSICSARSVISAGLLLVMETPVDRMTVRGAMGRIASLMFHRGRGCTSSVDVEIVDWLSTWWIGRLSGGWQ